MGIGNTLYSALFKRTSTFVLVIAGSTFAFERIFDVASESIFDNINKGKLWKDIKHKYEVES